MTALPSVVIPMGAAPKASTAPRLSETSFRLREVAVEVNCRAGVADFWASVCKHPCLKEAIDAIASPSRYLGGERTEEETDNEREYRNSIVRCGSVLNDPSHMVARLMAPPAIASLRGLNEEHVLTTAHGDLPPEGMDRMDLANIFRVQRDIVMPALIKSLTDADAEVASLKRQVADLTTTLRCP